VKEHIVVNGYARRYPMGFWVSGRADGSLVRNLHRATIDMLECAKNKDSKQNNYRRDAALA
jgi:hypothetical protein